ncbi:MAG: hypothetical protein LBI18_04545 [Planctomycetaceae bacterium]|jgi:hypothetical protein|nr:hypothetical protein [Planctomycetaceae bacterium]
MTRIISIFCIIFLFFFTSPITAKEGIFVSSRLVSESTETVQNWQVLVMVRPATESKAATPVIHVSESLNLVSVHPKQADLSPNHFTLFYVTISGSPAINSTATIDISLPNQPESKISHELMVHGLDLATQSWKTIYDGTNSRLAKLRTIPDKNDVAWKAKPLPQMWEEIGVTWLRTEIFVPKLWESVPMFLTISAIDDNDISFFNGQEIGRTNGWDTLREYFVPKELIRFGEVNEIVIATENTNAGGGISSDPIWFGQKKSFKKTKLFPKSEIQKEANRQIPRSQGKPLPLRPMQVRNGVLEYLDGGEVTLWGVNYYPQSVYEFKLLKEQKLDIKKVIDVDFNDLVRDKNSESPNRINVIRIHVFDTEISDAEGNLVHNEHLDMLDYLVSKCNEHGIYLWLTPIAWWGSFDPAPNSFSQQTPIQAMVYCSKTWAFQKNYLKQFLEHRNPYTKHRLVDEPCLNLFEIINEPLYWSLGELTDLKSRSHGQVWVKKKEDENTDADPNVFYRNIIRKEWNETLPEAKWESTETWDFFQYTQIRRYIETMCQAIRETGGKQPIAYSAWWLSHTVSHQAIADSPCEAITMSLYPGGLQQKPQADAYNLLPKTADAGWSSVLADKARLVYEFDASDTLRQIDLYPAMARYFRNKGVQVACQFQYDSQFNVAHNQAWSTHYLNAIHTPERFVSFLIGGEIFRTLPRGTQLQPVNPDEWIFPPAAVSYSKNAALLCKELLFMQAKPTDWKPLQLNFPTQPERIIAVGSTPYFDYEGTGIIDVQIQDNTAEIRLNPDVKRLQWDTLRGSLEKPLTQLESQKHHFRLNLPDWQHTTLKIQTEDGWKPFSNETKLESGKTYRLNKK